MRRAMVVALTIGSAVAALAAPAPAPQGRTESGWRHADAPRRFVFPRDHASHPDFRTEWWYYTGHVNAGGRAFGYQVTFFRVGVNRARESSRSAWAPHTVYFAHFALSDESRGRYLFHDVTRRPALGLAGADTAQYRVWIEESSATLLEDGTHRLRAVAPGFALSLDLAARKPPVAHGERGLSRKSQDAGNASYYYSLTRMDTRGVVRAGADSFAVTGTSWMDHEFGTSRLAGDQVGWDWFSLQLDDGTELMLYAMRLSGGGVDPTSSGTFVLADGSGRALARGDYAIEPTGRWTSPKTKAVYPSGWTVRVPSLRLDVQVEPTLRDQEMIAGGSGGITYWEGSVRVRGSRGGRPLSGLGYVELTGYTGPPPGL